MVKQIVWILGIKTDGLDTKVDQRKVKKHPGKQSGWSRQPVKSFPNNWKDYLGSKTGCRRPGCLKIETDSSNR